MREIDNLDRFTFAVAELKRPIAECTIDVPPRDVPPRW
jgi:hypothetical protein